MLINPSPCEKPKGIRGDRRMDSRMIAVLPAGAKPLCAGGLVCWSGNEGTFLDAPVAARRVPQLKPTAGSTARIPARLDERYLDGRPLKSKRQPV
jgi:hypothetical protein